MNILVACEESQRVCMAFREKGHRAFSCDVIECSGGRPECHIMQDVIPLLNGDCEFRTQNGMNHIQQGKWDMIIAFPPCTYLSNAGMQCFSPKKKTYQQMYERMQKRSDAAIFFLQMLLADCEKIAIENPVGFMSKAFQKPTQIIEPYYFANNENDVENYHTKRTCLWLKGLPVLQKTNELPRPKLETYITGKGKVKTVCWEMKVHGSDNRSKTFPGIAKAMAEQWG